jgi:hypothetical protein
MSKAHKHAELMCWAAQHWHEAEWRSPGEYGDQWYRFTETQPEWVEEVFYEVRLIRPRAIQPRREIPAPEAEELKKNEKYWLASPLGRHGSSCFWDGSDMGKEWLTRGLVYLSREDRDARVAAMLEIEREER